MAAATDITNLQIFSLLPGIHTTIRVHLLNINLYYKLSSIMIVFTSFIVACYYFILLTIKTKGYKL